VIGEPAAAIGNAARIRDQCDREVLLIAAGQRLVEQLPDEVEAGVGPESAQDADGRAFVRVGATVQRGRRVGGDAGGEMGGWQGTGSLEGWRSEGLRVWRREEVMRVNDEMRRRKVDSAREVADNARSEYPAPRKAARSGSLTHLPPDLPTA
jgi:hypothetical protein